jgi:hypothetical protein
MIESIKITSLTIIESKQPSVAVTDNDIIMINKINGVI